MTLNGPSLIAFSLACIGAAGLLNQESNGQNMSTGPSHIVASRDCMDIGIDTPEGRIGCITPVILPLVGPDETGALSE